MLGWGHSKSPTHATVYFSQGYLCKNTSKSQLANGNDWVGHEWLRCWNGYGSESVIFLFFYFLLITVFEFTLESKFLALVTKNTCFIELLYRNV